MKCLNCQKRGSHFNNKICPPCTDDGVTKLDIPIKRQKKVFIGTDCGKQATKFLMDLKSKKNIMGLRRRFVQHSYDNRLNEMRLSWVEVGGDHGNEEKS